MNQAKINAIIRQVFVALGLIIGFVPDLSPIQPFLPELQSSILGIVEIAEKLFGAGMVLWSLIGQMRTGLDKQSSEAQVLSLNIERPSFAKGLKMYLKAA